MMESLWLELSGQRHAIKIKLQKNLFINRGHFLLEIGMKRNMAKSDKLLPEDVLWQFLLQRAVSNIFSCNKKIPMCLECYKKHVIDGGITA